MLKFDHKIYEILGLQDNLIEEDKYLEVNIGQAALGYLKSLLREDTVQKVDSDELSKKILKSWKHYDDFCLNCRDNKLWMIEVDFRNLDKANSLIKKIDNEFNVKLRRPASWSRRPYGLTVNLKDQNYVVIIDSNVYEDENVILHEFMHYVQFATRQMIEEAKADKSISPAVQRAFGLDEATSSYVFHALEFWPNIFNDLFNALQKIYWLDFNGEIAWSEFIESSFSEIEKSPASWRSSKVHMLLEKDIQKNVFLLGMLACICYLNKTFFSQIVYKLKNDI